MIGACVCGGPLTVWLDWPDVPLANALRAPDGPPAPRHDLTLGRCHVCGTTAQMQPLPATTIFPTTGYPYRSGVAAPFHLHADALAQAVDAAAPAGQIFDVGGNDGSLAAALRARQRPALVVDPCLPDADLCGFFPDVTANLRSGSVAAITALNVFAHVPDPQRFAHEVRRLLQPDGVCVIEVLYLGDVLRTGALDTLYHEHWWTWSLQGLVTVLERAGLAVYQAESLPVQGGSVRVWAKPSRATTTPVWNEAHLVTRYPYEQATGLWERRVDRLLGMVAGGRWAGYAATAKATMLAYAANLGPKQLAYMVDDAPVKQGLWTPYDVEIVPRERILADPVDGLVLFAPSYAAALQKNLDELGYRGPVVVA